MNFYKNFFEILFNKLTNKKMKTLKQIPLVIFLLTLIISCDKVEPIIEEIQEFEAVEVQTISAKWNVNNSSEYHSFEFTENGNYIVVKNETSKTTDARIVLYGTYELIDANRIDLKDFGIIKISDINKNTISFSVILTNDSNNEVFVDASKQDEIISSTNTDLLCRTWKLLELNGEPVEGTDLELTVLFSKAGTYFVKYENFDEYFEGGLYKWKWKNAEETQLFYSYEEVLQWKVEGYVDIVEISENSLIIEEQHEYGGTFTYLFKPESNLKSGLIKSSKKSPLGVPSKFFNKQL